MRKVTRFEIFEQIALQRCVILRLVNKLLHFLKLRKSPKGSNIYLFRRTTEAKRWKCDCWKQGIIYQLLLVKHFVIEHHLFKKFCILLQDRKNINNYTNKYYIHCMNGEKKGTLKDFLGSFRVKNKMNIHKKVKHFWKFFSLLYFSKFSLQNK